MREEPIPIVEDYWSNPIPLKKPHEDHSPTPLNVYLQ